MPLSSSLRSPSAQKTGSAFTRKVAAGVRSLVGRVESLTKSHYPAPPRAEPLPRASPLRRWGGSLLARATAFAEQNLTAIPAAAEEQRGVGAAECAYDGYGSAGESQSTIVGTDAGSSGSTSTPAARVVPSSFFRQLLRSNEKTARRVGAGVRRVYGGRGRGRGRGRGERTSPRLSVHDLRGNAGAKRRPVPRESSVEDLARRCREAEGGRGGLGLKEQSSFRVLRREGPEERGADEGWVEEDSPYDDMESPSVPLVCWDKRYLNTDFEYMADGSLSNFGYLMRRLEFEAGISRPDSRPGTTTTTASSSSSSSAAAPVPEMAGVGRPEIVCPEPLNAVQSAELRGFAFRYT